MDSESSTTQIEQEDPATFTKIIDNLKKNSIHFVHTNHAPVKTSQEAADIRGSKLENGAKAILVRAKKNKNDPVKFYLVVMSASQKLDSKKLRKVLNVSSLNFADPSEVKTITGCIPGAVPPFGSVFGIQTYMDKSLRNVSSIDFNAGLRTDSVRMEQQDYEKVEQPIICEVTE